MFRSNLKGELFMTDDPELKMDETYSEDSTYSPKGRRTGYGNGKSLRIVLIILFLLSIAGGTIYFFKKGPTGDETNHLHSKVTFLEQRIVKLEEEIAELQAKITDSGKVESLEKQKQPAAESKPKPSPPPKQAVSAEKKYYTVLKGETLYSVSKKLRISVEELRKLNNLSVKQTIRTGQKLLVSPGR
jgi:LysM repeat protein